MSDDNNNDPFDFDFDALGDSEPLVKSGEPFDLDDPFGDGSFAGSSEAGISADNPFFDNAPAANAFEVDESTFEDNANSFESGESSFEADGSSFEMSENSFEESPSEDFAEVDSGEVPPVVAGATPTGKKKGMLSGVFGGKKDKAPKGKEIKEKQPKAKKEKAIKEKKPRGESAPLDWGAILCLAFSAFLLVSLLVFNIAGILSREENSTIMGTLCFLGAFNIVGLVLVAVPLLFYKFPQERTLPNVLLGISVGAMFSGVGFLVIEFSRYSFVVNP